MWWLLQVLNEVVVDRGPSAFIGNLDLYIEHKCITSVQGDGLYYVLVPCVFQTFFRILIQTLWCLTRRSHHLNADRKYGLRSCGGSIDGASKRTRYRHRSCVRTLPLLPPHHHSCWCRNQGASHACPNFTSWVLFGLKLSWLCVAFRSKWMTTHATEHGCRTTVATECSWTKATRTYIRVQTVCIPRIFSRVTFLVVQSPHQHLHLSGSVGVRGWPDERLVRQSCQLSSLERASTAEGARRLSERRNSHWRSLKTESERQQRAELVRSGQAWKKSSADRVSTIQ